MAYSLYGGVITHVHVYPCVDTWLSLMWMFMFVYEFLWLLFECSLPSLSHVCIDQLYWCRYIMYFPSVECYISHMLYADPLIFSASWRKEVRFAQECCCKFTLCNCTGFTPTSSIYCYTFKGTISCTSRSMIVDTTTTVFSPVCSTYCCFFLMFLV